MRVKYTNDEKVHMILIFENWPKETRNRGLTATGVENEIRVIEAVDKNFESE